MAVRWIQTWSQREPMVTGGNQLVTVAKDFYFQAMGGDTLVELQMDSFVLLFIFRWLIHVSTLTF